MLTKQQKLNYAENALPKAKAERSVSEKLLKNPKIEPGEARVLVKNIEALAVNIKMYEYIIGK